MGAIVRSATPTLADDIDVAPPIVATTYTVSVLSIVAD